MCVRVVGSGRDLTLLDELTLNNPQWLICHKTQPTYHQNLEKYINKNMKTHWIFHLLIILIKYKETNVRMSKSNIVLYSHVPYHNDSIIVKTDAHRKTHEERKQEGKRRKTSLTIYLPLTLLQGFERVVQGLHVRGCWETEHKLHILTPLLSPSRCVFLVLLDAQPEVLGSTPSGLFRGPPRSGVVFPTTSGL